MDNAIGDIQITEVLKHKYKSLYNSVPTSDAEMQSLYSIVNNGINRDQLQDIYVTSDIIAQCIKRLKRSKIDGNYGFKSDHLINGGKRLHILLSMLFKSMLIHGYNANDLVLSSIISIPKDIRSSLSSSDNYRGISLFNGICKLFDYVIMHTCNDYLYTSDMQFGFKPQHSTTMCSLVYHEIINHYMSNNSDVYSCLLDASKAFDKVHYGKLFHILLNRKVPFCIIRLLMDSFERQMARVMWNSHVSDYFSISNGVKQGGVISPVMFNLYLDNLLISLKQSGLGCHINGTYMGALGYADDITLTCPSLYGLNSMLDICNQFAKNNHVIFNTKKTICIKYGDAVKPQECAMLNDTHLSWGGNVRHLGNFFDSKLVNNVDSFHKCSQFIGQFNNLRSKFGHLQPDIQGNLLKTHCCSFFSSFLWRYNSDGFKKYVYNGINQ